MKNLILNDDFMLRGDDLLSAMDDAIIIAVMKHSADQGKHLFIRSIIISHYARYRRAMDYEERRKGQEEPQDGAGKFPKRHQTFGAYHCLSLVGPFASV
jgi:hypothetical protein